MLGYINVNLNNVDLTQTESDIVIKGLHKKTF